MPDMALTSLSMAQKTETAAVEVSSNPQEPEFVAGRTESWLQIGMQISGTPESISKLHAALIEAPFGVGTIAKLASELGGSSSARSDVLVHVRPALPSGEMAPLAEIRPMAPGTYAMFPIRFVAHTPEGIHVIEGGVEVGIGI